MKILIAKLNVITSLLLILSACSDDYEHHAIAIKNNTENKISVIRHYSKNLHPRTVDILPDEYEFIFETSTPVWVNPPFELKKICDSLIVLSNDVRISLTHDKSINYCTSPFSSLSNWERETIVFEVPKMIGTETESKKIHIFEIKTSCIIE